MGAGEGLARSVTVPEGFALGCWVRALVCFPKLNSSSLLIAQPCRTRRGGIHPQQKGMVLVNAWVSTHSEQTNALGKDLAWKDKYWGKNSQSSASGPSPLQLRQPTGNAGAVAGINACTNAMNFPPPVKVLLCWRRPVQRLVVLRSSFFSSSSSTVESTFCAHVTSA